MVVDIVLIDRQSEIGGRQAAHGGEHLKSRNAQIALRSEQVHL